MTLAELNAKDRAGFVDAIGWVFEDSRWVAERAWERRPFSTLDELHGAMAAMVDDASIEEQLALLRAHPDLGTADPTMSQASTREQIRAGFGAISPPDVVRLRALNSAYRDKFGFPFLYAVTGSTAPAMLDALERRLPSTRDAEQQEALRQVYRIARFRLEEVIS